MKKNYYNPTGIYNTNWSNTQEKIPHELINSFFKSRYDNPTTYGVFNENDSASFKNNAAAVRIGNNNPINAISNKFLYNTQDRDTTSLGHSEMRAMLNAIKQIPLPHNLDNHYGLLQNTKNYNENYSDLNSFYQAADKYKDYFTNKNTPIRLLSERAPCTSYSKNNTTYNTPGCSSFLNKILPDDNQVGYTAQTQYQNSDTQANTVKTAFDELKKAYNNQNQSLFSNNHLLNSNNNTGNNIYNNPLFKNFNLNNNLGIFGNNVSNNNFNNFGGNKEVVKTYNNNNKDINIDDIDIDELFSNTNSNNGNLNSNIDSNNNNIVDDIDTNFFYSNSNNPSQHNNNGNLNNNIDFDDNDVELGSNFSNFSNGRNPYKNIDLHNTKYINQQLNNNLGNNDNIDSNNINTQDLFDMLNSQNSNKKASGGRVCSNKKYSKKRLPIGLSNYLYF